MTIFAVNYSLISLKFEPKYIVVSIHEQLLSQHTETIVEPHHDLKRLCPPCQKVLPDALSLSERAAQ